MWPSGVVADVPVFGYLVREYRGIHDIIIIICFMHRAAFLQYGPFELHMYYAHKTK